MTLFGLLLPHFGRYADAARIIDGAQMAERLGFASVWARDHLVYEPHGFEDKDPTFLETFTTLTTIGANTQRLLLGTAAAIPTRHPLHLAHVCASMTRLIGGDRLILGLGAGGSGHEFDAVGLEGASRPELVLEQAAILRRLWETTRISHTGTYYTLDDVSTPVIPDGNIPLLYAGTTPRAARLAGKFFDGWLPGRLNLPTFESRADTVRQLAAARGTTAIIGLVPITSIGETREDALSAIPIDALLENANSRRFWNRPESGSFSSPEDLEGSLVFGAPEAVVEQMRRIVASGVDHVIFDLRLRFDDLERQINLLGTHVLPHLQDA